MNLKYNQNNKWSPTILFLLLSVSYSCATQNKPFSVKHSEDAIVSERAEKGKSFFKNDVVRSFDQQALVEKEGQASVYLKPMSGEKSGEDSVKLSEMKNSSSKALKKPLVQMILDIVELQLEAQKLMSAGEYPQALVKIEAMKVKYPKITFLNFIHSNCLTLLGDSAKAKALLEVAMKDYPENNDGKELLKILSGESPQKDVSAANKAKEALKLLQDEKEKVKE